MTTPTAPTTHMAVLRYGPSTSWSYIGLMLPEEVGKEGSLPWHQEPINAFALKMREGFENDSDRSHRNYWEINSDWSMGAWRVAEGRTSANGYAASQGGPALYTARRGRLMPPPAIATVSSTRKDLKQIVECQFAGGAKVMCMSNTNPTLIYPLASDGLSVGSSVETLSAAGKQMLFTGATLYIAQGTTYVARKTTDGVAFSDYAAIKADFFAVREGGVLCYMSAATFQPQGSDGYTATTVGWSETSATNMVFYGGGVIIFKPEGVFQWATGRVTQIIDFSGYYSTSNGSQMAISGGLLYFKAQNRLYYITPTLGVSELFPEDVNGFYSLDSLSSTYGPLLVGAHFSPKSSTAAVDLDSSLFMFDGPNNPGKNPLYARQIGTTTSTSATSVGTVADVGGGTSTWVNPTNILTSNDVYTTVAIGGVLEFSSKLNLTNFGVSVPTNAVITSIKLEVEGKATDLIYLGATLILDGVVTGATRFVMLNTPEAYYAIDGTLSQWAAQVSPSQVNSSSFGFQIQTIIGGIATVSLDHARVTVSYYVQDNWISACSTKIYDASRTRVYACDSVNNGLIYFDLTDRFQPYSFKTDSDYTTAAYLDTTEFTANMRTSYKWANRIIISCRNPVATTHMAIQYSTDGGTTWNWTIDEAGNNATNIPLSALEKGVYLPNNNLWTRIQLRLYMWTTDPTAAAEDIAITIEGMIVTAPLYRFSFPVLALQTVHPKQGPDEDGATIRAAIYAAFEQGYPCDLMTIHSTEATPEWYRVKFNACPVEGIAESKTGLVGYTGSNVYSVISLTLDQMQELDSDGTLPAFAL